MNTKGDLVNKAYKHGRISGLTKQPTPVEITDGLDMLENMAHEYEGRNIFVDYFFEDVPDANTPHNIERKYWDAFERNLSIRLLGDFGKDPMASLVAFASSGYSFLSSSTALVRQTPYPSRMPIGSGNRRGTGFNRYYAPVAEAPLSAETIKMYVGEVDDFTEHYEAYLRDSETVASYTITADTGLTIVSDSLATPDISYQISAVGTSSEDDSGLYQVTIVATTSDSRIETRVINFELTEL